MADLPRVLTAEQYRRLMNLPVRASVDSPVVTVLKSRMNKTEERYAQHLAAFVAVGEVTFYGFEAVKLRLADNTHWTPDFMVCHRPIYPIVFVDVKGTRKNGKPWVEEDAQLKIKVCAKLFPMFRFVQAWYWNGKWEEREY